MAKFGTTISSAGVKKIFSPGIAREVEKQVYFADAIGKAKSSMIVNIGGFENKGDENTYQLRYIEEDDGVTSGEPLTGNEGSLNYGTDKIIIDETAFATSMENVMTPQRLPWDAAKECAASNKEKFVRIADRMMFNHLCGYTPENITKVTRRGHNTIVAPSAGRYLPASGNLSHHDQDLTSANKLDALETLDWAIEAATAPDTDIPPMQPIGGQNGSGGIRWRFYIHPYCVTDFVLAKNANKVTWSEIALAEIQGGRTGKNKLSSWYLGKYKDVALFSAYYITNGVNSSTGAAIDTVKRNVFCGAHAGTLGFGKGYGWRNFKTVVGKDDDFEREYKIGSYCVWGFKKARFTKDGTAFDMGTIVIPAYGVSHH